jgi:hydrogenase expression/formation protein HypE
MRDPTRGGLATTLNEITHKAGLGISVSADSVPVSPGVAAASEILGLDPFYIANEGKLVAVVSSEKADMVLEIIRQNRYGRDAAIIGEVSDELSGRVVLKTGIGGSRILDVLTGDQLPRIC